MSADRKVTPSLLLRKKRRGEKITLLTAYDFPIARFINQAGVDIIRLWPEWIYRDPELIKRIQLRGKPVWTTVGNAPKGEVEKLIKLGVNGVLSDSPALMNTLLTP